MNTPENTQEKGTTKNKNKMSPKDKAKELFGIFENIIPDNCGASPRYTAKSCACAAVDQIMLENDSNDVSQRTLYVQYACYTLQEFYEQVKLEIDKV